MSVERARAMRKRMSPPEAKLWSVLRRPPFEEHHFRRQVQIGRYYADFASHRGRLVVEVDGGLHFEERSLDYDRQRDAFIAAEGYTVVRVNTVEVLRQIDNVCATILSHIATPTRPAPDDRVGPPSPQGGGRAPFAGGAT